MYNRTIKYHSKSIFDEDHRNILNEIQDAINDGETEYDFWSYEYNNLEKHMELLKQDGYKIKIERNQICGVGLYQDIFDIYTINLNKSKVFNQ